MNLVASDWLAAKSVNTGEQLAVATESVMEIESTYQPTAPVPELPLSVPQFQRK